MFTVSDIMTPAAGLRRADILDHAQTLFHEYDVVPFPRSGEIKGFFSPESSEMNELKAHHLLSDTLDLLELPGLLTNQAFYFIISGNKITGYVHYSDLNKHSVAIPFFALFRTAERLLWEKIENRVKDEELRRVFCDDEVRALLRKRQKLSAANLDLGWTGVFSFAAILKIARHFGAIHETDEEIDRLRKIRNKIAHSDNDIVSTYSDVQVLSDVKECLESILQEASSLHTKWIPRPGT
jgi:hypothetical protein